MSAQSSARSKRRQSALFSSHGRPSLLPLPQLSIHSVATSTPARGLQKHLPAPLPTPKAPVSRLLSTPAKGYDDNTTFFGFSPGVEANETALLAVDYRSAAGQHNEQNGDDLFDDTAVLEERAFANRRTSHDGDTSTGGLGALIFSNLVAGGHTQDALERLELGKRRESSTSRNSEHTSPVKRNASFTVSIGGDYLVDYETDVRFGDDIYEKLRDNEADAEARKDEHESVRINLAPPSIQFTSSPAVRAYTPTSPDESPTDASPSAARHVQSTQSPRQLPGSPVPLPSDTHSPLLPTSPARSVQTSHTQGHVLHSGQKDVPDAREQQQQPYLPESPAKSAVSASAEPSPTMAERRQARRLRRGLTASMAILLSPVAEDQDREKSISRSRSMLAETVESQSSMPHVLPPAVQEAPPRMTSQIETRREDHQVYTTVLHFGQKEPVPADGPDLPEVQAELPHTSEHASGDNGRIASREPVSLASMLVASLSQSNIDVTDHELDHAPVASSSKEIAKEPSGSRNSQFTAKSRQRAASASLPAHTGPVIKKHIREPSNSQANAPSYLNPTLSRSIRQRQSAKTRQTEMSQRNSRIDASRAAKTVVKEVIHTTQPIRQPKQKTKPPLPPRPIQTQKPADIPAPTARIVKKKSIDDLFERRQRDGARVPALEHPQNCTSSSMNGKGKEEQSRADEIHMRPVAHQATLNPCSAASDEALTVPRGFNFAAPRKRLRQESAAAPGPTSAPARVQVRRTTAQPETGKAPCRKARRVS